MNLASTPTRHKIQQPSTIPEESIDAEGRMALDRNDGGGLELEQVEGRSDEENGQGGKDRGGAAPCTLR